VLAAIRDVQLANGLNASLGSSVTHFVCARDLSAVYLHLCACPVPDVVLWQGDLAPMLELDEAFRETRVAAPPQIIVVRSHGGLFRANFVTCREELEPLVTAVKRALRRRCIGRGVTPPKRGPVPAPPS
jgi:hypothetical protein